MSRFGFRTRSGQISAIIQGQSAASTDADAQAFFDRVTTAGGTLSQTEKDAVTALVLSLKLNNIWTLMKAVYPMVGSSAAACSQNLKSSSNTAIFTSGWTFASAGINGNGASAYMNTNFNPTTELSFANAHIAIYKNSGTISGTDKVNGVYDIGGNTVSFSLSPDRSTSVYTSGELGYYFSPSVIVSGDAALQGNGFYVVARNANNFVRMTKNNTNTATNTNTSTLTNYPNDNFWLGATHQASVASPGAPNDYRYTFLSFGFYLDATQTNNFYSAVQTFQTSLSRQV